MTADAQPFTATGTACPDANTLQRLLAGLLAESEAAVLEQHVLECSRCCAAARGLSADDTLGDALQAHTAADSLAGEAGVQAMIDRLQALRPVTSPAIEETQPSATEPTEPDAWGLGDVLEPPQGPDELGRFGDYRVLRVLGSGGMGLVLEAEEARLKRRVALKIMKPSLAKQEIQRKRFLREAQATAAIEHPHIVTIFHVGEVGETPFLAMQLLKGESLDSRLRRLAREEKGEERIEASADLASGGRQPPGDSASPRPGQDAGIEISVSPHLPISASPRPSSSLLPLAESLRIGREIAEALAEAHERGLIHRDIKPSNVWLEAPRGFVKLVDFGLAHVADDVHLTQSGTILGTPAYMSPEQARGDAVDGRGDLFSLGCVLYKLLTGCMPFQGPSTLAVLTALAVENPKPPSDLEPSVPTAVSNLVLRLLSKRPEDRFESARAVAASIADLETNVRWAPPTNVGQVLQPDARDVERNSFRFSPSPRFGRRKRNEFRSTEFRSTTSRPRRRLLIATATGAALLFAGIIVIIRNKDGSIAAKIALQDGQSAVVSDDKEPADDKASRPDADPMRGYPVPRRKPAGDADSPSGGADPADSVGSPADDPTALPTLAEERAVAEWVLKAGGTVNFGFDLAHPKFSFPIGAVYFSDRPAVTDDLLPRLRQCRRLANLTLLLTPISDAGLEHLASLSSLRNLALNGTNFSDDGLKHLTALTRLENLNLDQTQVGDPGLLAITAKSFPRLRGLNLSLTSITDASLAGLATLGRLDLLDLGETRVTDAGLAHLKPLTNLRYLVLSGTQVTDAGIAAFSPSLPDCWITGPDGRVHAPQARGDDPDRAAAERLLSRGAQLDIVDGAGLKAIAAAADLPPGPFRVTRVVVYHPASVGDAELDLLGRLRQLETAQLNIPEVTAAGLAHLIHAPKLEELWLVNNTRMTDDDLAVLSELPRLRRLQVQHIPLSNAALRHMGRLNALEELHLDYNRINDAGLEQLKPLTELRTLSLVGNQVAGPGLRHLAALKQLSRLNLRTTRVNDAGLSHLAALPGLEWLDLAGNRVSAEGLRRLRALPRLLFLDLGGVPHFGDDELEAVAGVASLETLFVSGPEITDAGMVPLPRLTHLRWLIIKDAQITDAGLAHLKGLTNLETLSLGSDPHITDAGLTELYGLKGLKTLDLTGTAVTDAGVAALKVALPGCAITTSLPATDASAVVADPTALPTLADERAVAEWVLKAGGTLESGTIKAIEQLPKVTYPIRFVDLSNTVVSDESLGRLRACPSLELLALEGTDITDAGLEHLTELQNLVTLNVNLTSVTDAGLERLARSPRLETLTLVGTQVTGSGLSALATLPKLSTLRLDNTSLNDDGLRDIAGFLALDNLQFPNTAVTDAGLARLKPLTGLTWLNLTGTRATNAGIVDLQLALGDTGIFGLDGVVLPLLPREDDPDRAAAERLLAIGASLQIWNPTWSPWSRSIDAPAELPAEAFRITVVSTSTPTAKGQSLRDTDLALVGRLRRLQQITLSSPRITNAGLSHLAQLADLRSLSVIDARLTDAGLVHLKSLTNLETLGLVRHSQSDADKFMHITDAGLTELHALKELKTLDLRGTAVTDAGIAALKAALPQCQVTK